MEKDTEELLEKIKTSHSAPHSKAFFRIKNIFFWSVCIFSILIVLFVTGIVLLRTLAFYSFYLENVPYTLPTRLLLIKKIFPFIWLGILIGAILLIPYSIRNTKKGYKMPFAILAIIILTVFLFISIGVQITGLTRKLYPRAAEMQFFPSLHETQKDAWINLREGRIGGIIQSIHESYIVISVEVPPPRKPRQNSPPPNTQEKPRSVLPEIWAIDTRHASIHPEVADKIEVGNFIKFIGYVYTDKDGPQHNKYYKRDYDDDDDYDEDDDDDDDYDEDDEYDDNDDDDDDDIKFFAEIDTFFDRQKLFIAKKIVPNQRPRGPRDSRNRPGAPTKPDFPPDVQKR